MASKFEPYFKLIYELRADGKSWREVAEFLEKNEKFAPRPNHGSIYKWFHNRVKRAKKIAKELGPLHQLEKLSEAQGISNPTIPGAAPQSPAEQKTEQKGGSGSLAERARQAEANARETPSSQGPSLQDLYQKQKKGD